MTTQSIGVFGLGSMGYGMARSLLAAGHRVHGSDVVAANMERLQGEGGDPRQPADVAGELDAVVVVVLNADQTHDVLFGEAGIVEHLREGAVVLACATVAPDFARRMEAACAERGVRYLDAPISGGAAKAAVGELTIMASGAPAAFKAARPALDAMAERVFELGDAAGAGSAMKATNQLLAGVHIAAMGEAMAFALAQGIEPARFMEVIPQCAGTSWMLENRGPHVVDGDYAPRSAVPIWPKDLGIVLDIARTERMATPLAAAAMQRWLEAMAMGLAQEDDAAVVKVYAAPRSLPLPGGERTG